MLRSEVEVLSRGPDRGNPTSMWQGRGPELAGRLQCGWLRCEAPARAGLKKAVGALWWRTRVKRRKALLGGRAGQQRRCPIPVRRDRERIGDVITAKSQHLTSGDLLGSGRVWPVGPRTKGRRPMAQQKSEDRVVPEGGCNARSACRVEYRRAREGGPGRRNGVAAQSADRDSRKPARGHPQEDPGPAWGRPGGGAEGDRQGREGNVGDDGRTSSPPSSSNLLWSGDDSRSQTGRRRGS